MKKRKFAALAASLAMTAAMTAMAVPAAAQAATTYSTTPTTDSVLTTTFDKYLVMKEEANVPNAGFIFTVAPGTAVSATNTTLAVVPGVGTPVLKYNDTALTGNKLTFSTADSTTVEPSDKTDSPIKFATNAIGDEKYVQKTVTIDFSGVTFTEPGVYRYIITETGDTQNQSITNDFSNDANGVRTLDVYVEDAGSVVESGTDQGKPQLRVKGYVMYNGLQSTGPNKDKTTEDETTVPNGAEVTGATKNDTITNFYPSQNLTFGKAVKGNQGSKDKYFEFTLVISGIKADNTLISVDVTNADATLPTTINSATDSSFAGKTNPASLVANTSQTAYTVTKNETSGEYTITAKYYLQHGQYITVMGIPQGAHYSISETADDYVSTAGIKAEDSPINYDGVDGFDALIDKVEDDIEDEDIYTGYTNERKGTIPTGILSTVGGSVALAAVGIAGIAGGAMYLKKKKSEED